MKGLKIKLFSSLVLLSSAHYLFAVAASLSPVRINFTVGQTINSLTVSNTDTGGDPLRMQVDVMAWSQKNGQDQYSDTQDVLAVPPMITVNPDSNQIIRLALMTPPGDVEQTYRIFLHSFTPQKVNVTSSSSKISMGLNILTDFSVPIFIAPTVPATYSASWALGAINSKNKTVSLSITNTGNTHLRLLGIKLLNGNNVVAQSNAVQYVLAGATMTEDLTLNGALPKGVSLSVEAANDSPDAKNLNGTVSS